MMKSILILLSLQQAYYCLAFSAQSPVKAVSKTQFSTINDHRSSNIVLSSSTNNDDGPLGFLQGIFSSSSAVAVTPEPKIPDFVVDSDYTIAGVFGVAGVSLIAGLGGVGGTLTGGFITLLAILFAVQASRIRFVFDSDCFELKQGDDLKDSGENFVVGGANRWAYTSFVNWDFFPSLAFPILVYFKETQTPKTDGSEPGQIHFFPAVANCKQLAEQFELRGCASVDRD